ncbi:hypothetical protein [Roseibium sediminicola]|uniref:Secreted protein n=1 Tax=Roseibium sediminicola TaxID=2933272 RepID=A0ABT0GT74_9HYPH|nr:hypothetical protein [Roseibium sp. CAU 1639]MCK7612631.1 hypothetical protein [Roseibium sp. CAU 1639]
MSMRHFLKAAMLVSAMSCALPAAADPADRNNQTDLTAARIVLASLHRDLTVPVLPNLSPWVSSREFVEEPKAEPAPLLQFAGRCGSSDYYCDSPGYTYCCGNSTDGFYCAADVNGC